MKRKGIVAAYNRALGYGFISDDSGHEVFVQQSELRPRSRQALDPGVEVEFEPAGPSGLIAKDVVVRERLR